MLLRTLKPLQHLPHLLRRDIHGPGLQGGAGGVLSVGGETQTQTRHIFLPAVLSKCHAPGGLPHEHRQYAGGHGVQGAAVAHPFFMEDAPDLGTHVHAGPAGGFINNQDSVGHWVTCLSRADKGQP